ITRFTYSRYSAAPCSSKRTRIYERQHYQHTRRFNLLGLKPQWRYRCETRPGARIVLQRHAPLVEMETKHGWQTARGSVLRCVGILLLPTLLCSANRYDLQEPY